MELEDLRIVLKDWVTMVLALSERCVVICDWITSRIIVQSSFTLKVASLGSNHSCAPFSQMGNWVLISGISCCNKLRSSNKITILASMPTSNEMKAAKPRGSLCFTSHSVRGSSIYAKINAAKNGIKISNKLVKKSDIASTFN